MSADNTAIAEVLYRAGQCSSGKSCARAEPVAVSRDCHNAEAEKARTTLTGVI